MDSTCVSPQSKPQMSGLAIASLVFSCLSIVPLPGPLGCLLGIVFGHLARGQIRKNPDTCGEGVALAGLIIGYTFLVLYAIVILWVYSIDLVPGSLEVHQL